MYNTSSIYVCIVKREEILKPEFTDCDTFHPSNTNLNF